MKRIVIIGLLFILTMSAFAAKFRVITPYVGVLNSNIEAEGGGQLIKLDDSGLMEGLYYLCLDPAKRQWNAFVYGSQDVNSSDIFGTHIIYDRYFKHSSKGRYVLGAGVEYLQINTSADVLEGLPNFDMTNKISAPYLRAGRYFNFEQGLNRYSVFVWGGYERDIIRGDFGFDMPQIPGMPVIPGMPSSIEQDIESDYNYALAGVALKATFMHFLELKVKYHRKFSLDDEESFNVLSVMTNVFLNRKWGLSYRYKDMKETFGSNAYHIGGVVYVF